MFFLLIAYTLFLSVLIYPLILLVSWYHKKSVRVMDVLSFIRTAKTAQDLNIQMIEESKIVVLSPNIIGAFIAILAEYFDVLQISKEVIIALLISHFCLIVLTTIGEAFLRMALTRLLLIFMGEILMSWALVGGSLLFIFQIFEFRSIVGDALSGLLIFVVSFFLVSYGYFRMKAAAQIYASGVEKKPIGVIEQDKFTVAVARNIAEAQELAKDDYEKFDEFNGEHIYRKSKETN